MSWRFRRSMKVGPFRLNFGKTGLSSVSVGPRGASVNIPVGRSGGTRTTVGIPGTGLSWSSEQAPARSTRERQQAQRVRPQETSTESTIREVMAAMVGPEAVGDAFWRQRLIDRVLNYEDTPRRIREAALLVKSAEMVELHMRRARGPAATRRAAQQVIQAAQDVLAWTEEMGWSEPAD